MWWSGHPYGWGRVLGLGSISRRSVPICICGFLTCFKGHTCGRGRVMGLGSILGRSVLTYSTAQMQSITKTRSTHVCTRRQTPLHAATNKCARGDERVCRGDTRLNKNIMKALKCKPLAQYIHEFSIKIPHAHMYILYIV